MSPHFRVRISPRPFGQSWSNFTGTIIWMGDLLYWDFEADLIRTLVTTATKCPTDIEWGKCCPSDSDFIFEQILIKLASNENSHKISDKFDFGPNSTNGMRVTRPWVLHRLWKMLSGRQRFHFDRIFIRLTVNRGNHYILDELNFGADQTFRLRGICPLVSIDI